MFPKHLSAARVGRGLFTAVLAGILGSALPAAAANVTVTVNTVTQLNSAIASAELNPGNFYTIKLLEGTYYLTSSYSLGKAKIELVGYYKDPSKYVLDAKNLNKRLFTVVAAAGQAPRLLFTGVTLRNGATSGSAGGCIYAEGNTDLTVSHSIVEKCVSSLGGSGIFAQGARVNLFQTIVRDHLNLFYHPGGGGAQANGGGFAAYGNSRVDITRCTFTNNTSVRGGGIYIGGSSSLNMFNSTIAGNVAHRGAGIMIATTGNVRIDFNTIAFNKSGQVAAAEPRVGGGILFSYFSGLLYFQGNILAENDNLHPSIYPTDGDDCYVDGPGVGRWSEARFYTNLIGKLDPSCVNRLSYSQAAYVGYPSQPYYSGIRPLQANGTNYGQTMPTISLWSDSPARAAFYRDWGYGNGGRSCPSDDQRAKPRRAGPAVCDIGALEVTGAW